jgi:glucan biosynthesis protein C
MGIALSNAQESPASKHEKPRLLYIDNIRVLLIVLVVLHHLAVTYGAPGGWYYIEYNKSQLDIITSLVLTLFVVVNQAFFMGLFYFIAGYFTPISLDRKGSGEFLKDRLLRLGIPLLFYIMVISPVLRYVLDIAAEKHSPSIWDFIAQYAAYIRNLDVGPLWFIEFLLMLSIVYVVWRTLTKRMGGCFKISQKIPGNLTTVIFVLIMGLATFIVRIWLPVNGNFQPLGLQFPFFSQYIGMFVLGIIAYRGNWLGQVDNRMANAWQLITGVLILSLPILFALIGGLQGDVSSALGGVHWQSITYAAWEQFVCIGMTISLLTFFYHRFNSQGSLLRAMSASVFTVFILHAPILVGLALLINQVHLYPLLKFILVAPLVVAVCFLIANGFRKLPIAREIL